MTALAKLEAACAGERHRLRNIAPPVSDRSMDRAARIFRALGDAPKAAVIGPSIGPCCYRVGGEVAALFDSDLTRDGMLDLWTAAERALLLDETERRLAPLPLEAVEAGRDDGDADLVAEGVVAAAKETGLSLPLVVRLEGNNVEAGKATLAASGLNIVSADSMDDGAKKIVAAVQ